jgi:hypothetical protein
VNAANALTSVALIAVGVAIVSDYRSFSTRMRSQNKQWWSAGRIRRRIPQTDVSPRWSLGLPLIVVGMLILLLSILSAPQ